MKTFQGPLVVLAAAATVEASASHEELHLQAQKSLALNGLRTNGPQDFVALSDAATEVQPVHRRPKVGSGLAVGDEVCITGPIMDNYCIYQSPGEYPNRVNLDQKDVITLKNPEKHTIYCLLDVGLCEESGFQVLGHKNADTDLHCPGFRLDDTAAVLAAGRKLGKKGDCTSCLNEAEDAPTVGLVLTVKGKIGELGDGSDTPAGVPLLTDLEVLDPTETCDGDDTVPPMCMAKEEAACGAGEPEEAACGAGEPEEAACGAGEPAEAACGAGEPEEAACGAGEPEEAACGAGEPEEPACGAGEPADDAEDSGEPADDAEDSGAWRAAAPVGVGALVALALLVV